MINVLSNRLPYGYLAVQVRAVADNLEVCRIGICDCRGNFYFGVHRAVLPAADVRSIRLGCVAGRLQTEPSHRVADRSRIVYKERAYAPSAGAVLSRPARMVKRAGKIPIFGVFGSENLRLVAFLDENPALRIRRGKVYVALRIAGLHYEDRFENGKLDYRLNVGSGF